MKRKIEVAVVVAFGLISIFALAQTAASTRTNIRRYVIVTGDSQNGSWDSDDSPSVRELRARYGDNFAWFRESGREYIITDVAVMAELEKAMDAQTKVNAKQEDVNADQERVNDLQTKVNAHQSDVNSLQQEVNRRQEIANRMQSAVSNGSDAASIDKLQAELRDMRAKPALSQGSVNQMQAQVNTEQESVNSEQEKVNGRQRPVNEEQRRVSADFAVRVNQIFHDALEHGAAESVK